MFCALGGVVVGKSDYAINKRHRLQSSAKIKESPMWPPGYYTEVAPDLQAANGYDRPIPGDGWDWATLQSYARAIKGNYISSHFSSEDKDPMVQTFVKEYTKLYKRARCHGGPRTRRRLSLADAIGHAPNQRPCRYQRRHQLDH